MASLVYTMFTSLDGYTADASGNFDWAMPDAEVHAYANELGASIGTNLYGRRMYETMVYWETADTGPDAQPESAAWARQWQATDKIIYSSTLTETRSKRTRIERAFDPSAVQALKASSTRDLAISGPTLASHALRAGLVDEIQQVLFPVVVGGGTRFLPPDLRLALRLLGRQPHLRRRARHV